MKIVIVDDEVKYARLIQEALRMDGHETWTASSGEEAWETAEKVLPHLVISDITMPGMSGLDLLDKLRQMPAAPEVIMVTARNDARTAVTAMKNGAFEYVTKPFDMDELSLLAAKVAEKLQLQQDKKQLESQLKSRFSFASIIGRSGPMAHLFEMMDKVRDLETLVLIRGESGTGKELVAKALHFQSIRAAAPFIPVNCAAIPENLIESELFGHTKGSFTGADRDKQGVCEAAGNGTLFLDEIGELPQDLQAKFLRMIQEREFRPLGSNKTRIMKARIICATNSSLEEAIICGDFREDLFHRINVFPLYVPPLSERKGDIPLLVEYFLKKLGRPDPPPGNHILEMLSNYSWPGNVRELENALERAAILAGPDPLSAEHFSLRSTPVRTSESAANLPEGGVSLDEVEKNYLLAALEKAGGNKTKAAELLSITRRAIYSKMKTHGLV